MIRFHNIKIQTTKYQKKLSSNNKCNPANKFKVEFILCLFIFQIGKFLDKLKKYISKGQEKNIVFQLKYAKKLMKKNKKQIHC